MGPPEPHQNINHTRCYPQEELIRMRERISASEPVDIFTLDEPKVLPIGQLRAIRQPTLQPHSSTFPLHYTVPCSDLIWALSSQALSVWHA
jgi:hypothetical protein